MDESDINIIVSGNKESIISVEGECHEAPDADVLGALRAGQEAIAKLVEMQEELVAKCGKPKREVVTEPEPDEALAEAVMAHWRRSASETRTGCPKKKTGRASSPASKRMCTRPWSEEFPDSRR